MDDMREQLADVQHEIWSDWMKWMFKQGYFIPMEIPQEGSVQMCWVLPAKPRLRWERQMNTPYDQLSEREKESDRDQADKVLVIGEIATLHVVADAARLAQAELRRNDIPWWLAASNAYHFLDDALDALDKEEG